jgi:uncharacterized membrane protein
MYKVASKKEAYVLSIIGLIQILWSIHQMIALWNSATFSNMTGHSIVFVACGIVALVGLVLATTPFRLYRHRLPDETRQHELARNATGRIR